MGIPDNWREMAEAFASEHGVTKVPVGVGSPELAAQERLVWDHKQKQLVYADTGSKDKRRKRLHTAIIKGATLRSERAPKGPTPETLELRQNIVAMISNGAPIKQIASDLRLSPTTVYDHAKAAGLGFTTAAQDRAAKLKILKKRYKPELTASDLAKLTGCTVQWVYKNCKQLGLPLTHKRPDLSKPRKTPQQRAAQTKRAKVLRTLAREHGLTIPQMAEIVNLKPRKVEIELLEAGITIRDIPVGERMKRRAAYFAARAAA